MTDALRHRLLDRISIGGVDECWTWQCSEKGTGRIQIRVGGKGEYVHRLVYEWLRGPIPEGHGLHHTCEVQRCVNPRHLVPVDHQAHQIAHDFKGIKIRAAIARAKAHCRNGHEYTEENTYWTKKGQRVCNECRRSAQRARYHQEALA